MKKLFKCAVIPFVLLGSISITAFAEDSPETNYEEKLPYMFKDPNWEKYANGDTGVWPLPEAPTYSTGLYSMASNNSVDYKEDQNQFYETASKYKSSGNIEVYYQSNPSTSVTMALPSGSTIGKSVGGDTTVEFTYSDTSVPAYNNIKANNELILDSSQGQWLVTNGYYSRDNTKGGIKSVGIPGGTTIEASPLLPNPWGLLGTATYITPEDFLMGLSKSIYGVIQSRPVYVQTTPNRLAKKVTWTAANPRHSDGSCGPITWTYQTKDWAVQDVSNIVPNWADTSAPSCGTSKVIDRGEYIVHPEGYLNNVWYRYRDDQNSFVSPNVYELYFSKLLQKGILSTDVAFANATPNTRFTPDPKNKANNFSFNKQFADKFFVEYQDFGKDIDGTSRYKYPAWATELGALYTNPELTNTPLGYNITDKSIGVTYSGGANPYQKALGSNYNLSGNSKAGITSIQADEATGSMMAKNTVTVMSALQMIERAMRVEDGDMSHTEADIVSKKYGAQYLDDLSQSDKQTVSYLLAKGVLNFENYQEYSNLYSPLSQSFAYKLMYRIANEDARLQFTEVTLTDSLDLPSLFSEYRQAIVKADLAQLSMLGSLTDSGKLIKNESSEPLTLLSDITFSSKAEKLVGDANGKIGTRYVITASIDDPMKYLYRSMPLVNVEQSGKPVSDGNKYNVYISTSKELYNDISEKDKRYVGINSIRRNPNTNRYDVQFYAYGDNYDTALLFVKANLQTRIANVSVSETESSVISEESGAMSSTKGSDLNSSISSNNDLIVNRDFDLTAYSNSKTSIVGNSLVPGPSAVKVGENILASLNVTSKLTNTTAFETIGSKQLVSVDSSQLKGLGVLVQNPSGGTVGRTTIINDKVSSKPSTKGKGDITTDITAYNLSMLKSTDTVITEKKFTYTDSEGNKRQIPGSVIISWNLDLPTVSEQNSLVGSSVTPYVNDGAKSSWIFTKPTNKSLLSYWEYNTGLNNALLKTLSKNGLSIPSGYFSPTVDILVDSLNVKEVNENGVVHNEDLTEAQLREIENNFASEVGQNLSSGWVQTYIGSVALANHIVGSKIKDGGTAEEIKQYIDPKLSDKQGTFIKPSGLLKGIKVPVGKTVWSELVFKQEKPNDHSASYFDMHSTTSNLNLYTMYSAKNGNHYYGEYFSGAGEGITPQMEIPYVKDNFNNLYHNVDFSQYSYDTNANILREESSYYTPNKTGTKLTYKEEDWYVADDTPYTLNLVSKKFITGVMKDGKIYQSTSGAMETPLVLDVIHDGNIKTFGRGQEKGIDSDAYMRTQAFDFVPSAETIKTDIKFIGIKNGVMLPYIYKNVINQDGSTNLKLEETTLDEGEIINVPSFVVLSKAVWSASADKLIWSKKYIGAEHSLYTKGSIVQGLKEQLLNEQSKNLVLSQDVKTGTLKIGNTTGTITNNNVTFTVPYTSNMIAGTKINTQAVLDAFNMNADVTITDRGETASSAQYLKNKKVGSYDPYYKNYNNTLVDNKGKLQVASGTKLADYTSSSVVDSVSLTAIVMDGVRYLNNGASSSSNVYKIHQYQTIKPPAVVAPFTDGAPPVLNADNAIVAEAASNFEGLPTALELFDSLQDYLSEIAVKNAWFLLVIIILGTSVVFSITTLLAHVFAHAPISNTFFDRMMDITGIDFLAIFSVGAVRITMDTPNSWIKTLKTSIFLGIVPIVIFGVMRVYGLV